MVMVISAEIISNATQLCFGDTEAFVELKLVIRSPLALYQRRPSVFLQWIVEQDQWELLLNPLTPDLEIFIFSEFPDDQKTLEHLIQQGKDLVHIIWHCFDVLHA